TGAVGAIPYFRALVRSLREHWLGMRQAHLQLRRLDARGVRPDRRALILREEASREAALAEERVVETLHELLALDGFCSAPVKGLVLIPCQEGDQLAWFVFDLFAPQGQELSRFQAESSQPRPALLTKLNPGLVDEIFASRNAGLSASRPEQP